MYLLTVKVYEDSDNPYTISVCLFQNKGVIEHMKVLLNDFIQQCIENKSDCRLSNVLADYTQRKKLIELLKLCLYNGQLVELLETLEEVCKNNYVYVVPDIFDIEYVKVIM